LHLVILYKYFRPTSCTACVILEQKLHLNTQFLLETLQKGLLHYPQPGTTEQVDMTNHISLVVATKDRPDDLRKLLLSLSSQTARPSEIIVVDASRVPVERLPVEFPNLSIRYLWHWPPSAAAQRNVGIDACNHSSSLIGFADDDTTFETQAFANMLRFWSNAPPGVLGAAFNIRNLPSRSKGILKNSALVNWLGIYSKTPGGVALSGWHTVIGEFATTQFVDWIPSTAAVFRREVFDMDTFDEVFQSYSYLEDLDLSYSIRQRGCLAVIADACFSHFPSSEGRISTRLFGRYEVRNRLYFVRKHHLSLTRCYLGIVIRMAISIGNGLWQRNASLLGRAVGNFEELISPSAVFRSELTAKPNQI
jgi:GT2 family glycosyltransferase